MVLGARRLGGDRPPWSPPAHSLSEAGSPQPLEGHIPPTSPLQGPRRPLVLRPGTALASGGFQPLWKRTAR